MRAWLIKNYLIEPNEAAMALSGDCVASMFGVTRQVVVQAKYYLGISHARKPLDADAKQWLFDRLVSTPDPALERFAVQEAAEKLGIDLSEVIRERIARGAPAPRDANRGNRCREWMREHLINGPKTSDNVELAMTDVEIVRKFQLAKSYVMNLRQEMGIPGTAIRLAQLPREKVKPGGEPRAWLPPGANACCHLRGLVRRPGYKEPAHCLCGLVLNDGEIERSRCHDGCPHYEKNEALEKYYARNCL